MFNRNTNCGENRVKNNETKPILMHKYKLRNK